MEGEERKCSRSEREPIGGARLSALQEQLIWALLSSGLSREVLVQALGELERDRQTPRRGGQAEGSGGAAATVSVSLWGQSPRAQGSTTAHLSHSVPQPG